MPHTPSISNPAPPRHSATVRVTHWLTVISFLALLISGAEIIVSHPRFYLGEVGNVNTHPLFIIPIPASRDTVPTGYNYLMPDQNGWSRYLHFQAAWAAVLTGIFYVLSGLLSGHFRKDLIPTRAESSWQAIKAVIKKSLRRTPASEGSQHSYNVLQRITYLAVIFLLFPLIIWTGLAMSPSFTSAFPITVIALGGRQTARTLHFFVSIALVLFVAVHVAMVIQAGFRARMRAMIIGNSTTPQPREPIPTLLSAEERP